MCDQVTQAVPVHVLRVAIDVHRLQEHGERSIRIVLPVVDVETHCDPFLGGSGYIVNVSRSPGPAAGVSTNLIVPPSNDSIGSTCGGGPPGSRPRATFP